MMEYFVVYTVASGSICYTGSGPVGITQMQERDLTDGQAVISVPQAALTGNTVDLAMLKSVAATNVGAAAEAVRQRFITPGSGKAMSYQAKLREAESLAADAGAPAKIIRREALARNMAVEAVAAEVLAMESYWTDCEAIINGVEMGAKKGIADAPHIAAIVAAAAIDWDTAIA